MSAPQPLSDARIRAVSAGMVVAIWLFAAVAYLAGDASLLVAALTARPEILVLDSLSGELLLASVGFALIALPFLVPPIAPRYYLRRPWPAPARFAVLVIVVGGALAAAGVFAGGLFQSLYLEAIGYRMCGSARAGVSRFLEVQTWAQPRQDCPAAAASPPAN